MTMPLNKVCFKTFHLLRHEWDDSCDGSTLPWSNTWQCANKRKSRTS